MNWRMVVVIPSAIAILISFPLLNAESVNGSHVENGAENYNKSSIEVLSSLNPLLGYEAEGLTQPCKLNMELFWNALHREESWAIKMFDANGRYNGKLFFGQNFWLGSFSLCRETNQSAFNLNYNVAKISLQLNKNLTGMPQLIYLGLCLPTSCTTEDVTLMISRSKKDEFTNNQNVMLNVLNVRSLPGSYNVLSDKRFYILGAFILLTIFVGIFATFYEYHLTTKRKDEKVTEDTFNNNNNINNLEDEKNAQKTEKIKNLQGPREIILSFSLLTNYRKICSVSKENYDNLAYVHGLRFLTLAWVILVHTYLQLFAISGNKFVRVVTERSFMYQTVGNATYSVDTFFFISGLLMTNLWKTLHDGKNNKVRFLFLRFYSAIIYRVIRLTPMYFIVLTIFLLAMTHIRSNSVFEPNIADDYNCAHYWWRNILYINNFYPSKDMCMLWSWYMSVDTQFFVFSTIIIMFAIRHFKWALAIQVATLLTSWCTTALISYVNSYEVRIQQPFGLFDAIYDKPWTRVGSHIIGITVGLFIHHHKELKLKIVYKVIGWVLSIGTLFSLVYGLGFGFKLNVAQSAIYVALGHTLWGCALAWIVVACHFGFGGVVNKLLSMAIFHPLSRLTFCAYLAHPVIMVLTSYVMDESFHIHNGLMVIIFMGNLMASYLFALLLSLFFEAPLLRVTKFFLK